MSNRPEISEKVKSRTVTLSDEQVNYLDSRGRETDTDRSKYLRTLIRRDMDGPTIVEDQTPHNASPDALSPTIIRDLASRLCGEVVADRLDTSMQSAGVPYSQPALLKALLDGLDRFFVAGGYFSTDEE